MDCLLVTDDADIACRFTAGIDDALNAEIALGTVANVHDAIQWLGYTYLFIRMRKNPLTYGKHHFAYLIYLPGTHEFL